MNTPLKLTTLALALFLSTHLFAKPLKINQKKSYIAYTIGHKLHDTHAVNHQLNCAIDYDFGSKKITRVAAVADVKNFDSGNGNLDSHMMEVVNAIKFPAVKFLSTSVKDKGQSVDITGNMTFHGVTKEVAFTATKEVQGKTMTVKGEFPVKLEDFGVERPSLMMVPVDEAAQVEFVTSFDLI